MIHGNYVIDSEVTFGNERQLATSSCCARVQYQVLTLLRLQALDSSCLNTTTFFQKLRGTHGLPFALLYTRLFNLLFHLIWMTLEHWIFNCQNDSGLVILAITFDACIWYLSMSFFGYSWNLLLLLNLKRYGWLKSSLFDEKISYPQNSTSVITLAL